MAWSSAVAVSFKLAAAVGADTNVPIATGGRIAARAPGCCADSRGARYAGGGRVVILSWLIGGWSAAKTLIGDGINGAKSAQLGLTWKSVDDPAVEERALELGMWLTQSLRGWRSATSAQRSPTAQSADRSQRRSSARRKCGRRATHERRRGGQ